MDNKIIYSMHKVGKVYKQREVLKNISLSYFYGAKIGVLGLNGSGKSTLLKIMAGVDNDFLGEASLTVKNYEIGYLEQDPQFDDSKTVRQIISEGVSEVTKLLAEFNELNAKFLEEMTDSQMETLLAKQAELQDKLDALEAWDIESKLDQASEALNCPPGDQLISTLSGGEKRRVALCRLLLKNPDILLLDEPTNHLDAETVWWLERFLKDYPGTVIAVTHDRYFLDNVAGWILELDRGFGIPFKGNYTAWLEQKNKRLEQEERQESKRQRMLKEELTWIQSSPKARQAKNKARIERYEERRKLSVEKRMDTQELYIPDGPKLGDQVIVADKLSMKFGDKILYKDLSFNLPKGGIIGIIGENGTGKSTLFKIIMGKLKATSGSIKIGDSVKFSYVDQDLGMDKNKTILEVVSDNKEFISLDGKNINARSYISKFNFYGDDHLKKIGELSGGEKHRAQLAMVLKQEGNVLLLDEPTNDLDVNTLQALEEALLNYSGCAVVISHDRYFLDRIVTHILAFEGDGTYYWHLGNFTSYEEEKVKQGRVVASSKVFRKLTR